MCHRTKVINQPSLGILYLRLWFYGEDRHHGSWSLITWDRVYTEPLTVNICKSSSATAKINANPFPSDHSFHGFAWTTLPTTAWQWPEKLDTTRALTISSVLLFCHVKSKILPPTSPGRYQVMLAKRHSITGFPILLSHFGPSLFPVSL